MHIKDSWKERKIFKMIILAVITIIIFVTCIMMNENIKRLKNEEFQRKYLNSVIEYELPGVKLSGYGNLINHEDVFVKDVN